MPVDQSTLDNALGPNVTGDFNALRSSLKSDEEQRTQLLPKLEQARQEEAGVQGKTANEAAPVYEKMAEFQPRQSQLPTPQAPQEYHKPELDPGQLKQAAGAMLVISGLVGAFSRNGWTGALTNMTAAMKGIQEGNEQQAKTAKEQYDASLSHFKTQLEALKEDRASLEKMDQSDLGALRRQLEFIAHKNDAELIAAQAKTHGYTDTLKSLDKHIQSLQTALSRADNVSMQMDKVIERHDRETAQTLGAGHGLDMVDYYAAQELAGIHDWKSNFRGKEGQALLMAVARRVPMMARESNITPEEQGTAVATRKALTTSLRNLENRKTAVDLFSDKLERDMNQLDSLLDKAAPSGPVFMNKPMNQLRRQFNDTDLAQLDMQARQVAVEYERLITSGGLSAAQLHRGAQEDAQALLNGDLTPQVTRAKLKQIAIDMNNAKAASNDAVAAIKSQMSSLGRPEAKAKTVGQPYSDPDKEARYQKWKAEHGQ